MNINELIERAINAKKNSYSPYSNFKVGAALVTKDGKIYEGANIESASYSPTNCAERTAFFKAVYEGERNFSAIAVAGGFSDEVADYCYPCGVCRQVMMEFCDPEDFKIIIVLNKNKYREHRLKELLPYGFGPGDITSHSRIK